MTTEGAEKRVWLATVGLGREFGGVSHVARTTLAALSGSGSEFRVQRIVSLFDPAGVPAPVRLPAGANFSACGRRRLKFFSSVSGQIFARPDFVLYDHVDIARCQTFLPRGMRAKYGVWVHGIEVWKTLPARKLRALHGAAVLLVNSGFTLRRMEEWHGPFPQAVVVPLTAGPREESAVPLPSERLPAILTVGRLEPGRPKGHREILAAMPEIIRAVPDVHWHIAGTGNDFSALTAEVQASGLGKWITLHGFVKTDDLEQLFRNSRVFCMPSEGEGFGVVYLEAMMRGCIPVGSTMDAAFEVIGDGGICVDQRRPGDVAAAIVRLLTLPGNEVQRWRQRCLERAGLFSPGTFAENLWQALRGEGGAPNR